MKNNREILSSMVKTTAMGKTGLRAVLHSSMDSELRKALEQQMREYDAFEESAQALASARGWELRHPNSGLQKMIENITWMKIPKKDPGSRIADMVIQGNTQGMISSIRDLNHYHGTDQQVVNLNRRLIDCETENICQMKPFL